jgi:hypothetical protein
MAQKYPAAYIIEPAERKLYENRSPKMIQTEFLNNCGGLYADRSANRESFIQTNPKIRFLVVGMGLMGAGKTYGFTEARTYCQLLNSTASRKEWETIEAGNVSHDTNITTNQNYKRKVRNLFFKNPYNAYEPWTQEGWNRTPHEIRKQFAKDMHDIYYNTRHGARIDNTPDQMRQRAEQQRKLLTRQVNLQLETPGEGRLRRKRRILQEFEQDQQQLPQKSADKFPQPLINQIKNIKTQGGSAVTYRNLRKAILQGKNIEYETVGSSFTTLKTIFEVIVESTNNCRENYTYIVLGVLNLCSIQESFNQQLCRFFNDSRWFTDILTLGNSWEGSTTQSSIAWGAQTTQQKTLINITPGPRLSLDTTTSKLNDKLYNNIKALIETCNKPTVQNHAIYRGECLGFGIDFLLVTYNTPSTVKTNKLIATLPLSIRSQYLLKSTQTNKPVRNIKFNHNLVIDILNRLQRGTYARNPTFNININCNTDTEFRDVHTIITTFLDRTRTKGKTIYERERKQGSQAAWKNSLNRGGKRQHKNKTKRKRKRSKKKKTRRRH